MRALLTRVDAVHGIDTSSRSPLPAGPGTAASEAPHTCARTCIRLSISTGWEAYCEWRASGSAAGPCAGGGGGARFARPPSVARNSAPLPEPTHSLHRGIVEGLLSCCSLDLLRSGATAPCLRLARPRPPTRAVRSREACRWQQQRRRGQRQRRRAAEHRGLCRVGAPRVWRFGRALCTFWRCAPEIYTTPARKI